MEEYRRTDEVEIERFVERVHGGSNTLLLVGAGWTHLHYMLNFLWQAREVTGSLDHIVVVCLDSAIHALLTFLEYDCYWTGEKAPPEAKTSKAGRGRRLNDAGRTNRWPVAIQLLKRGIHVLVIDSDAPLLRNPFESPPIAPPSDDAPAYSELVDVIGQQSGMPDVAEKVFGAGENAKGNVALPVHSALQHLLT